MFNGVLDSLELGMALLAVIRRLGSPGLGTALLAVTRELDSPGLGTALLAVTRDLDSPGLGTADSASVLNVTVVAESASWLKVTVAAESPSWLKVTVDSEIGLRLHGADTGRCVQGAGGCCRGAGTGGLESAARVWVRCGRGLSGGPDWFGELKMEGGRPISIRNEQMLWLGLQP